MTTSRTLPVQSGAAFPLKRAADTHRMLEAGEVMGKAVLTMDDESASRA